MLRLVIEVDPGPPPLTHLQAAKLVGDLAVLIRSGTDDAGALAIANRLAAIDDETTALSEGFSADRSYVVEAAGAAVTLRPNQPEQEQ